MDPPGIASDIAVGAAREGSKVAGAFRRTLGEVAARALALDSALSESWRQD